MMCITLKLQKRYVRILKLSNTCTDIYIIPVYMQEPVGGAARFATAIKQRKHLDPIIVFSGDAFNPSLSKYLYFKLTYT